MPEKPLDDVWVARDLPVLAAVTSRIDATGIAYTDEVLSATELDARTIEISVRALMRRGYITDCEVEGEDTLVAVTNVSGSAYLVTGLHPDGNDLLAGLARALELAAGKEMDVVERGRLRSAAQAIGSLIGQTAAGVAAGAALASLGIGL